MVLNNLECTGNEASILDCRLGLTTVCERAETAGVRCLPRTGTGQGYIRWPFSVLFNFDRLF